MADMVKDVEETKENVANEKEQGDVKTEKATDETVNNVEAVKLLSVYLVAENKFSCDFSA